MPHYKDGKQAYVGDHVVGKPYNTDHDIAGTVVSITPDADSCNLQVEFIESVPSEMPGAPNMHDRDVPSRSKHTADHGTNGPMHQRFLCRDYGEVKAFTLVARPSHVKE